MNMNARSWHTAYVEQVAHGGMLAAGLLARRWPRTTTVRQMLTQESRHHATTQTPPTKPPTEVLRDMCVLLNASASVSAGSQVRDIPLQC
jgi:hypothetical protein